MTAFLQKRSCLLEEHKYLMETCKISYTVYYLYLFPSNIYHLQKLDTPILLRNSNICKFVTDLVPVAFSHPWIAQSLDQWDVRTEFLDHSLDFHGNI